MSREYVDLTYRAMTPLTGAISVPSCWQLRTSGQREDKAPDEDPPRPPSGAKSHGVCPSRPWPPSILQDTRSKMTETDTPTRTVGNLTNALGVKLPESAVIGSGSAAEGLGGQARR